MYSQALAAYIFFGVYFLVRDYHVCLSDGGFPAPLWSYCLIVLLAFVFSLVAGIYHLFTAKSESLEDLEKSKILLCLVSISLLCTEFFFLSFWRIEAWNFDADVISHPRTEHSCCCRRNHNVLRRYNMFQYEAYRVLHILGNFLYLFLFNYMSLLI
jgi:hypothetical protein